MLCWPVLRGTAAFTCRESWPALRPRRSAAFSGSSYAEVAKAVLGPLVDGDIPDDATSIA